MSDNYTSQAIFVLEKLFKIDSLWELYAHLTAKLEIPVIQNIRTNEYEV